MELGQSSRGLLFHDIFKIKKLKLTFHSLKFLTLNVKQEKNMWH
jgi:hypothetical protein